MSIQQKQLVIGLFGFGVVGEGLYKILQQTPTLNARIKKVCIKHIDKQRNAPKELFTIDPEAILNDKDINIVIELTNDAEAAFYIATTAFRNKKAVISANKKMIADNLQELLTLQQQFQQPFLYESAACASIPVIRNLEEYYDNDLLQSISGIVNGSTNYILSKIADEKIDFKTALKQAQEAGFAETDPTLDINGTDAVNKLSILLTHAYGIVTSTKELLFTGIQNLKPQDANFANEKGYTIKLVAQARKLDNGAIGAFVLPQFIKEDNQLFHVTNENNGVIIETSFADKQFFYGKGAGSFPTASAVLSDLSALRYDYKYEYKKLYFQQPSKLTNDFSLKVYISFEKLHQVPHEVFEHIIEWCSNETYCYIIGIIKFSSLIQNNWWRNDKNSLIVLPEPFEKTLKSKVKLTDEFYELDEIAS